MASTPTGTPMGALNGDVEAGFGAVADAFRANFADGLEIGASFCAYVGGRQVVELWGGTADASTGRPWERSTPAVVFSATKGMTATCAAMLLDRGRLDVDAPVAKYWPEFGAAGKGSIPVKGLLGHTAGLVAVDEPISLDDIVDWDPVIEKIERQATCWEPGTQVGYHASTFGWLVGEVVRRITGTSIGGFFRAEVGDPLGLDAWIGVPEARLTAVARLEQAWGPLTQTTPDGSTPRLRARVFANPGVVDPDEPRNLTAERPAGGGVANGRALARMYAALIGEVDGIRLISAETVENVRQVVGQGTDQVLGVESCWGLGFSLAKTESEMSGLGSFGHTGAGGAIGWAHPERQLAVG
jgi:CubicO group peptidase (beta-lactamase class C family)